MFVIPCRYNGHPFIQNCVRSIRQYHPQDEILVVDSDSIDKSYFNDLESYNVQIADIANKHYHTGALQHAYDTYPREYYYIIQDSMEVRANFHYCQQHELTTIGYFSIKTYGWPEETWGREQLKVHVGLADIQTDNLLGIFGGLIFCSRQVLDHLYSTGFKNILETKKLENESMERMYGIVLGHLGYNLTANSIMGNIHTADHSKILKFFPNRP